MCQQEQLDTEDKAVPDMAVVALDTVVAVPHRAAVVPDTVVVVVDMVAVVVDMAVVVVEDTVPHQLDMAVEPFVSVVPVPCWSLQLTATTGKFKELFTITIHHF